MCETYATAETLTLLERAGEMAEELLGGDPHRIHKAMDLSTPKGLDLVIARMASRLLGSTSASSESAVRAAIAALDVDWAKTTTAERRQVIDGALRAAGRHTVKAVPIVTAQLGAAAGGVVEATREQARRVHGLHIGADFNAVDHRVVRHITSTQANFVRDHLGRRLDAFGAEARRVVAAGVEAGLGRQDIAEQLQEAAQRALVARSSFYWEQIASAFVSGGRSLAQLSAFTEAGIERYAFEAVLDEQTTDSCRLLHGKVFSTGTALDRFDRVAHLKNPEDIKSQQPWVRSTTDPETGRRVLYVARGDRRVPIAEVVRSGLGTSDDPGEFARVKSERELMDLGIGVPPLHGLCRSQIIPVL